LRRYHWAYTGGSIAGETKLATSRTKGSGIHDHFFARAVVFSDPTWRVQRRSHKYATRRSAPKQRANGMNEQHGTWAAGHRHPYREFGRAAIAKCQRTSVDRGVDLVGRYLGIDCRNRCCCRRAPRARRRLPRASVISVFKAVHKNIIRRCSRD